MNKSFIFTAYGKEKYPLEVWNNIHHDVRNVQSDRFLVKSDSIKKKSGLFQVKYQNGKRKANRGTFINQVSKDAKIGCNIYEDDNISHLVFVGDPGKKILFPEETV